MFIKFRKMILSDINNVINLINRNLEENLVPLIFLNDLFDTSGRFHYVCLHNNKVIGNISCTIQDTREHDTVLQCHVLCVDFPYRTNGIGTRLMEIVKEEATSLNIRSISLYVRSSNLQAKEFYIKQGFEIIKEVSYYENGALALLMKYTNLNI
ncbi:N-alpha-acetlytransferase [Vairimorpha necatrix]|uniref:N-alpha-acetlytransferase n=1 Tax=Vairimorpha necatrix TaxID=6039 RepID=A0AAX4JBF4_9MICR